MIIKSLYLRGYKRLSLPGIHVIHITLHKRRLCLLGSNGCGKSSVVHQLSPLPGEPSDFKKGGAKILECESNGNQYTLESLFDDDRPRFNFIKNGENLNPGRTITVFKQLVKAEFGITDEIHEVMIGTMPFNAMQVNQRRQWFTKMPGVNYEYAIAYYKKLKERHSTVGILLKSAIEKSIKDKAMLLSDDQIADMSEAITSMKTAMEELLAAKDNNLPSPEDMRKYRSEMIIRSDNLLQSYDKLKGYIDLCAGDPNAAIARLSQEILVCTTQRSGLITDIEAVTDKLCGLEVPDSQDVIDAPAKIQELTKQYDDLLASMKFGCFADMPSLILRYALNCLNEWTDRLSDTCLNLKKHTCTSDVESLVLAQQNLSYGYDLYKRAYDKACLELEHVLKHKGQQETECPQCAHKWVIGYSDRLEARFSNDKRLSYTEMSRIQKEIEAKKAEIEEAQEQLKYTDTLKKYYHETARLLNGLVLEEDWHDPMFNVGAHQTRLIDIKKALQAQDLYTLKQQQQHILQINDDNNRKLKESLLKQMAELESRYASIDSKHAYLTAELQNEKTTLQMQAQLKTIQTSITALVHDSANYKRLVKRHLLTLSINQAVVSLKTEISSLEHTVMNARMQVLKSQQSEQAVKELTETAALLKQSLDILSPTDGLIAEGLHKFLSSFIKDMNDFISKVWTYPLEIICETPKGEDLDLDFKFEVRAEGSDGVPDAKKSSMGQKEIIDLAFRITSMKYRGLKDYPIFLDEFGVFMDHTHKHRAIKAITDFVADNDSTQIFLVSHFASAYASMNNAQFVVLHKDNIIIPDSIDYQTGVYIEYVE